MGAVESPVYQSTTFTHATAEALGSVIAGRDPDLVYTRIQNPALVRRERSRTMAVGLAHADELVWDLVQAQSAAV